MKIKKTKEVVKKILLNVPECKDNDLLLILKVWAIENPELRNDISFKEFAKDFLNGKHTNTESIRRSRAKLQEEEPTLRGSNYKKRHEHQGSVKKELGYYE